MKLQNRNIVILSLAKLGDQIQSTNFTIARHLAKDNCVYYIENPRTWKDVLLSDKHTGGFKEEKDSLVIKDGLIDTDLENLKVLAIPSLPSLNFLPEGKLYRKALKLNTRIIARAIKRLITKKKIDNYIFINSFNFYYPDLANLLSADLNVYHCVDPIIFPVDCKHGLISEQKIVEEADLIICTSKQLRDEKALVNKNTFFIPNAADYKHSSRALRPELAVHEKVSNIKKPVVGYFGNIERRMDYELIDRLSATYEDISFVFAGPVSTGFAPEWFFERPNIYLTGAIPYEQMPAVLKGFDVAIIPFKKDEVSSDIFPLKLFEYLGTGKPVVATDFNIDLADLTGSTVAYCGNLGSFSEAINKAIYHDSEELKIRRLAVAAANTWEKRSEEFSELINNSIDKKLLGLSQTNDTCCEVVQPFLLSPNF